jgi:hypothetical protein
MGEVVYLMNGVNTLASSKQLWQILRFFVGNSPFIVFFLESCCLLFAFFSVIGGWFFVSVLWGFLNFCNCFYGEFFEFDELLVFILKFFGVLKTNNSLNFSKNSFNREEFIHVS